MFANSLQRKYLCDLCACVVKEKEASVKYDFRYEVQDGVATVTFDRPDVLNALTFEIYAQFRDLLEALRYDDAVHVLLLTGAGRGFCSGGDVHAIIGELLKRDMKDHLEFTRMTGAVVANMRLLDKPIIAALNGTTAGAGAVIALAADLRLASERARIAFLFTQVGLTGADMGASRWCTRSWGAPTRRCAGFWRCMPGWSRCAFAIGAARSRNGAICRGWPRASGSAATASPSRTPAPTPPRWRRPRAKRRTAMS